MTAGDERDAAAGAPRGRDPPGPHAADSPASHAPDHRSLRISSYHEDDGRNMYMLLPTHNSGGYSGAHYCIKG
eukprot:8122259-Pyramimonas_sp.AAC.1